jgi:serine beta-lactamase-like protein LACTB, mitochondrial
MPLHLLPLVAFLSFQPAKQDFNASVRAAVGQYCIDQKVPGCSATIGVNGRIVAEVQFGYADAAKKTKVSPSTLFRLASVSKPVTATALLTLVQQGKIGLDTDARKYVPEFPEKTRAFTVRQLLCHQAGIRHYVDGKVDNSNRHFKTVADSLALFQNDPLIAAPGEKYSYSTHAYTLVSRIIEKVSGQTFGDNISALAKRAGAPSLSLEDITAPKAKRSATFGLNASGEIAPATPDDLSWKYGGGGMESTSGDLCRFGMALAAGKILNRQALNAMWTPQPLSNGQATSYGLGWIVRSWRSQILVSHDGQQLGARSEIHILPESGIVIVVLTNRDNHPISTLADKLQEITTGAVGEPLKAAS